MTTTNPLLLINLPAEMLVHISQSLPTPDLCNLRLTCRHIEATLRTPFGIEFFANKQFMMSPFSLQALIDISESRMATFVRNVQLGTDVIVSPLLWDNLRDEADIDHDKLELAVRLYTSQFELLTSGLHRDMLAKAFRAFKTLDCITIRDRNNPKRYRDGSRGHPAEWTSYGSTTARDVAGLEVHMSHDPNDRAAFFHLPTIMLNVVLLALADAGASSKGLVIFTHNANTLNDWSFCLDTSMKPGVIPVLQGLSKLHVAIQYPRWLVNETSILTTQETLSLNKLPWFLTHTTNLTELRINGSRSIHHPTAGHILRWLAMSPHTTAPRGWPRGIELPNLKELSFGNLTVYHRELRSVLWKFGDTLRSFELYNVCLIRNVGEDGSPWAFFLRSLIDLPNLGGLRHYKLTRLVYWIPRNNDIPSQFAVVEFKDGKNREYTGPNWRCDMANAVENMVYPEPYAH